MKVPSLTRVLQNGRVFQQLDRYQENVRFYPSVILTLVIKAFTSKVMRDLAGAGETALLLLLLLLWKNKIFILLLHNKEVGIQEMVVLLEELRHLGRSAG